MNKLDKLQPFLILLSVCAGLILSNLPKVAALAAPAIFPLLAFMLYTTFLPIPLKKFGQGLIHSKVVLASLVTNFLWTPVFAWGLGAIFLKNEPDLWVGLIMLMVTPCTDWYIVFTGIAGGDVMLATALLPLNLILQVILLPIYLMIFAATLVDLHPTQIFEDVIWILFIPLFLAIASRYFILRCKGKLWFANILSKITLTQIISLNLAICAIFTSQGNTIIQNKEVFLKLLAPIVLFFIVNFVIAYHVAQKFQFPYPKFVCLSFTTLARNSPLSLAIAVSAFPDKPLLIITLVVGPLIELPILALVSQFILQFRQKGYWNSQTNLDYK